MTQHRLTRRRTTIAAACAAVLVAVTAWPSAAKPATTPSAAGDWLVRMDVNVGPAQEAHIGRLQLSPPDGLGSGQCSLVLRSNFTGHAHNHEATTCVWSGQPLDRPGLDGAITATGIAEPGAMVISFVLADRGNRLLLLLDDTPQGIIGTGEAFRR